VDRQRVRVFRVERDMLRPIALQSRACVWAAFNRKPAMVFENSDGCRTLLYSSGYICTPMGGGVSPGGVTHRRSTVVSSGKTK
jgi:hypothetical protein